MKPLVLGHRGASAYAPENTLAAFNLAFEQGADGIELDVTLTKDRVPVVIHDNQVDRTTDGHGDIRQMTFAEVQQLDAGCKFDQYRGERIPTLAQVLDTLGTRGKIVLEIKRWANEFANDGRERIIANVIRQAKTADNLIVSSFHPFSMYWIAQELPQVPRAFIYHTNIFPWLVQRSWFRSLTHPRELHINEAMATSKYVRWAKNKKYSVTVYHPDEPEPMRRYLAMGVAGIMSNKPDVLRQTVDQYYTQSKGQ